ncbi:luciferin 4-monooxygenase-like [Plodia interpunctella]|uniref:luciferin 4-monooxygenase-like n=1 Tax=Plodia interpunctella TaxID=58824 RepID=UPI002368B324|nr:luciferin 4-monooxygenase-like [Plodia interpunctella]
MLIKYRTQHVIPVELEELIRSHPGVLDAGVTNIPHPEDGEHPVACVVRRPGSDVTAEQIKELVAEKLSSSKQLRGGVVFLDKLPLTSTDKLARAALRKLVLTAQRE